MFLHSILCTSLSLIKKKKKIIVTSLSFERELLYKMGDTTKTDGIEFVLGFAKDAISIFYSGMLLIFFLIHLFVLQILCRISKAL